MLEGALKIEGKLKMTIAAHGAVVPGEFYRTGRLYRLSDGQGNCKHKPSKRARKDTNEA